MHVIYSFYNINTHTHINWSNTYLYDMDNGSYPLSVGYAICQTFISIWCAF